MTAMPRFEEGPEAWLTPSPPAVPRARKPKPAAPVEMPPGPQPVEELRAILPAPKPRRGAYHPSRFLFEDARPPVRERKETTHANRRSRPGRRAALIGTRLNLSERRDLEQDELELAADGISFDLPPDREACLEMPRPCPFVRCRHHLAVDEEIKKGEPRLKVNFPHLPVWEIPDTCSLDVADRADQKKVKPGSFEAVMSYDEVGAEMNLSGERIRHLEARAFKKIRAERRKLGL